MNKESCGCGVSFDEVSPTYEEWMRERGGDVLGVGLKGIFDREGKPMDYSKWVWTVEHNMTYKIVKHTHWGEKLVSTVWLGMDLNFGRGKPILFETMVFNVPGWEYWSTKYRTEEEALAGHMQLCQDLGVRP